MANEQGNKKGYTIFIVDDDKFLLDMYSVKFKEQGMQVEVSESGEKALTRFREGLRPDVLLLDILMPGMDGFGVLEAIRKEGFHKDLMCVVLSNLGQESDIKRAKELGAEGYIVKASAVPSEVLEQVIAIAAKQKSGA